MTSLRQLKKIPGIPVSTREEHRRSPHNSRRAPVFLSHLEMRGRYPASSGKESRCSLRTSREDGLKLNFERIFRGSTTILKDPDVPIQSRSNRLPCTDWTVTPRIDSKHNGMCDSPVAPREKANDPYVNDRKTDATVTVREESALVCHHTRLDLTPLCKFQRNCEFHVSTGEEP